MTQPEPQAVDEMFNEVLHTEDDVLAAARQSAVTAGMPAIEVSAQHGKLLSLLATISGASRVLEIGTLAGYSTINLARGIGTEGRVTTLEYSPEHAAVARANFERAGVADQVEVLVGAALDTLPQLAERGEQFDFFFIDADKENNSAYVEWAVRLATPGAVIVVDNVTRMGRVLDPAADDLQAQGVRNMLELVGNDPRLEAAAIQTVGAKGWDGFAVARVGK
ncbi:O-methyltransferase [Mycobacteroides abscessus subsp. abscessus]|nr:O-methyltransferase [Mycobacteroides abscessus subsp. abscessus]